MSSTTLDSFSTTSTPSNVSTNGTKDDSSGFIETATSAPFLYILIAVGVIILLLVLILVYMMLKRFCGRSENKKSFLYQQLANQTKKRQKLGDLEFILDYDYVSATLGIELLAAKDLNLGKKQVDEKEMAAYCKVYLLPHTDKYHESKIVRKTFSPAFNQKFTFKCVIDDLDRRKILVRIYRHHKFLRDAPIGDAEFQLCKTDLQLGYCCVPVFSYNPGLDDPLGEICISLRYNSNTSKLGVTIIECKNLKATDWGGTSDPYVKVTCKIGDKVQKEKTAVMKKTLNPYFNTAFSFKVPPQKLGKVDLLVQVKDKDIFGANEEIGAVRLGLEPDSERAESQWDGMIQNLKRPQTEWHFLLPSDKQ